MDEHALRDSVRFTRDGRRLLLRDDDRLAAIELPDGGEHALAGDLPGGGFTALRGFVGFDSEVWVAAGESPARLFRFSPSGARIGEPIELSRGGESARLLAAPFGNPSALWTGDAPCELRLDGENVECHPIAPGAAFLLPLSPGRRLELREGVLQYVEPSLETPLTAAGSFEQDRLLDGAAILDERAVALIVERAAGDHTLLVLAPQTGLVQHRLALGQIRAARFAPARGHAMLQLDERRLMVIDLRFGRALKEWTEPAEVVDFSVDLVARGLVLRRRAAGGGTEIFFGSYRDLLGGPSAGRGGTRAPAAKGPLRTEDAATDAANGERGGDAATAEGAPADALPADVVSDGGEEYASDEADAADEADKTGEPDDQAAAGEPEAADGTKPPASAAAASAAPARATNTGRRLGSARATPLPARPTAPRSPARLAHAQPDGAAVPGTRPLPGRTGAPSTAHGPLLRPPVRSLPGSTLLDLPSVAGTPSVEPAGAARSPGAGRPRSAVPAAAPPAVRARSAPAPTTPPADPSGLSVGARPRTVRSPSPARGAGGRSGSPLEAALDLVAARAERALSAGRIDGWLTDGDGHEAELAAAEAEVAEARTRFRAVCGRPPLGPLASQLGLTELALELGLIAAAPWLRPELAPVFSALGGAADGTASLLLCTRLLHEHPITEILAELDEDAPLVRHHLLGAPSGPAAPLPLHPLLVPRLRGAMLTRPGRRSALSVPAAALALDELALPAGLVDALLPRFAGAPRLMVRGHAGSGRRSLVTALADAHGRQPGFIDARAPEIAPAEAADRLADELRDAVVRGLLPCAVGVDELPPAVLVEAAARLAAHPGALVVIAGPAAAPLPGLDAVDLPPQSEEARAVTVARALRAQHLPEENIEAIAARVTAPPGLLWHAAQATSAREWPESHSGDLEAAFVAAHKRLRAERLTPGTTLAAPSSWRPALFDAVTEDALAELRARCARSTHGDAARAVALLVGPTGSGRRLAGEMLSGQLGYELHRVEATALADDPDAAPAALGRLLEALEEGELVLHLTGADALLAAPPPALLRRLASLRGVLLLSVESERALAAAARTVITTRVPFPRPDTAAREAIWRLHLPRGLTGIDTTALARHELTGGAIRSAVERALLIAASEGIPPAALHFERAARLA